MNINFHYFAVRAILHFAGFDKERAQFIASVSQFVDDFDVYWLKFHWDTLEFYNPITTGFNDTMDMIRLGARPDVQKNVVVPFHFIPPKPLSEIPEGRRYRTKPAVLGDGSLMSRMLRYAQEEYWRRDGALLSQMRVGMYLHIFADTYAHQRFNGFNAWENELFHKGASMAYGNNLDLLDLYDPVKYTIGHGQMGTAPDETFLQIKFCHRCKVKSCEKHVEYARSNPETFLIAAKEILRFLMGCRHNVQAIDDKKWSEFKSKLRRGFESKSKDANELAVHWAGIFPEIAFRYDKDEVLGGVSSYWVKFKGDPVRMECYNQLAKEVRAFVHGTCTVPGVLVDSSTHPSKVPTHPKEPVLPKSNQNVYGA